MRNTLLVLGKNLQRGAFAATTLSLVALGFVEPPTQQKRPLPQYHGDFGGSIEFQRQRRQQQQQPYSWNTRNIYSPTRVYCEAWPTEETDHYYYEKIEVPARAAASHAIFGQLLKEDLVERYQVYKRVDKEGHESSELVLADIQIGVSLDGHEGVVHGGILALLFDDSMGFAYEAAGIKMAVTANLNIDYRAPMPANTRSILRVHLVKREGRKVFLKAQLTSHDGSLLFAEASSLYIIPREYYEEDNM